LKMCDGFKVSKGDFLKAESRNSTKIGRGTDHPVTATSTSFLCLVS